VTYDLAVWEGQRPASNAAGLEEYLRLIEWSEEEDGTPPTPAIAHYVEALLARWPDIGEPGGEDSPWGDGPMLNNAIGSIIYFSMVWSRADEASAFASDLAAQHGLVCFDPQWETLRP
jgi:hypothetical protein